MVAFNATLRPVPLPPETSEPVPSVASMDEHVPLKYTDAYLKDLETMLFRVESIISDFPIQFLHSSPLRQTYSKV